MRKHPRLIELEVIVVYDQNDRKRSTLSVLKRIEDGSLKLHDQIGVIDAEGSREVVDNDYVLYHLSADGNIIVIRHTTAGSIMRRYDEVTGLSNDDNNTVLVEPTFQLAVRDKLKMEGKRYAEDIIAERPLSRVFDIFGRRTGL
jgi:hypothetical protein